MAVLTEADKTHFVNSGFVILRGLLTPENLDPVNTAIEHSQSLNEEGVPPLHYAQTSDPVRSLLFDTPVRDAVEDLLGPWDDLTIRDSGAQIAITKPNESVDLNGPLRENWHIDSSHGPYASVASDFLLLVGIALTEGQEVDENRGQLVIFPGT